MDKQALPRLDLRLAEMNAILDTLKDWHPSCFALRQDRIDLVADRISSLWQEFKEWYEEICHEPGLTKDQMILRMDSVAKLLRERKTLEAFESFVEELRGAEFWDDILYSGLTELIQEVPRAREEDYRIWPDAPTSLS